ncbi:hypothetical protein A5892_07890 [Halotalea alkalilenta]|uniref:Solute-binding protein family 3/N-terminal domain-containing protein n=1 Tax=Halotalea alkalilenta TaxID=376489 RepID=A0A172YK57_9GAMM|nr:hypothetical protein A5892_07890 [Halotalea alkalilenta]
MSIVKRPLCLITFSLAALLSARALAEPPLKIAVDVPYAPFQLQHADGSFDGFEVELVNAICTEMQRRCEWVKQPWDGIIPGLLSRKYDIIASALSVTEERARQVRFAEAYYVVPSSWVAPADRMLDPNDDLSGRTIGVQRSTIQDDYVTRTHPQADIRRYPDASALAADMSAGRLDLAFITTPLAQEVFVDQGGYRLVGEPIREPREIFGDGIAAAFRPRDEALVERFDRALHQVVANGTYEELMERYFDYDVRPDGLR